MAEGRYLLAREAAEELGVRVATLYAYVSRGMIRSEAAGGSGRRRRYRAEDVRRLKERKARRRDPDAVVEDALSWGTPVLESEITLVSDDGLYYRGRDAVRLSAGSTVEAFQVLLPLAGAGDPAAYDLRPGAVARTGARILRLMASAVAGEAAPGLAETLRRGWCPRDSGAATLLSSALVLCADHELPVSTFAARCVASSEATPYAVVAAGLAAVGGVRHGGQIELVEAFLREVESVGDARAAISGRLRRGEGIPGFGHSLYPGGDPRGAELLRATATAYPDSPAVARSVEVAEEALGLMGERPTVDLGLVTLAQTLGLPSGGAVAPFAVGRTGGWIGHAIEQYESGSLIRPRARYVGVPVS